MKSWLPYKISLLLFVLFTACLSVKKASARELYGYQVSDSVVQAMTRQDIAAKKSVSRIFTVMPKNGDFTPRISRAYDNRSFDFLLILSLVIYLALFRAFNSNYFRNLFKAFSNSTLSSHQLRDPIESNTGANLGMNIFACLSMATYIFYATKYIHKGALFTEHSPYIILLSAVLLLIFIYGFRLSALKFVGWAFQIDTAASTYAFNILLINKILSVVLLPFTAVLAWGEGSWVQSAFLISLIIVGIAMLNRITRSGDAMRSFIRYSKFHFFLYLCASEIFPIAIVGKVVYQWLVQ